MKDGAKNYFIPSEGNDYKPHILRQTSVAIISGIAVLMFFAGALNVAVIQKTNLLGAVISQTLVDMANSDRAQNALGSLSVSPMLTQAAQDKAYDMATKGYFAHTSPDGKTPWYWFEAVGYDFSSAGENLAENFSDSADVNSAWMNSPDHRANILSDKFSEIGIATATGVFNGRETTFVVELFGKPAPALGLLNDDVQAVIAAMTNAAPKVKSASATVTTIQTNLSPKKLPAQATTGQIILGESDTFIALKNDGNPAISASSGVVATEASQVPSSLIGTILASPKKTVSAFYFSLGLFVFISLLLMIGIEIKRQHPKYIALGITLLVFIIALAYIFRMALFGYVVVI